MMDVDGSVVVFNHGKESGPWGTKIRRLAKVVEAKGLRVESVDYTGMYDPDKRVEKLLDLVAVPGEKLVLVGSSMGGYVATVASKTLQPRGLFLLAPALYIKGYAVDAPVPTADALAIVHGWHDEVIPAENSIRFAEAHRGRLHLVNSDHRLIDRLEFIAFTFDFFLDQLFGSEPVPKNRE